MTWKKLSNIIWGVVHLNSLFCKWCANELASLHGTYLAVDGERLLHDSHDDGVPHLLLLFSVAVSIYLYFLMLFTFLEYKSGGLLFIFPWFSHASVWVKVNIVCFSEGGYFPARLVMFVLAFVQSQVRALYCHNFIFCFFFSVDQQIESQSCCVLPTTRWATTVKYKETYGLLVCRCCGLHFGLLPHG